MWLNSFNLKAPLKPGPLPPLRLHIPPETKIPRCQSEQLAATPTSGKKHRERERYKSKTNSCWCGGHRRASLALHPVSRGYTILGDVLAPTEDCSMVDTWFLRPLYEYHDLGLYELTMMAFGAILKGLNDPLIRVYGPYTYIIALRCEASEVNPRRRCGHLDQKHQLKHAHAKESKRMN